MIILITVFIFQGFGWSAMTDKIQYFIIQYFIIQDFKQSAVERARVSKRKILNVRVQVLDICCRAGCTFSNGYKILLFIAYFACLVVKFIYF